jgi:hypothetical protein
LRKLGEDITERLEYVPARFKVIQHARGVGAIAGGVIGYTKGPVILRTLALRGRHYHRSSRTPH